MKVLRKVLGFEWDEGNKDKNLRKHEVTDEECEEIFFDAEKTLLKDVLHSKKEARYIVLGKTKKGRLLFVIFTIRKDKARIISARDLNKKERSLL